MRKLMSAVAAIALLGSASAANAQDWTAVPFGKDAVGWWSLEADAGDFCRFSSSATSSYAVNATSTPGAAASGVGFGGGGSVPEADGKIVLQLQNPANNTVRFSTIDVNFGQSQCNFRFDIAIDSLNGGLKYEGPYTTTDTDFLTVVPYKVGFRFDGTPRGQNVPVSGTSLQVIADGVQPTAGLFEFGVAVDANPNKLLLSGRYYDWVQVILRKDA